MDGSDSSRAGEKGGRAAARHYGRLGLQLALAFVAVALGAVAATVVMASLTVISSVHQLVADQLDRTAKAAALGAATSYRPTGWAARLAPEVAVIDQSGARIQVRDETGKIVRSSPGYSRFLGEAFTNPVIVARRRVGSVTVKFGEKGIAGVIKPFITQRWEARLSAGALGVLFAVTASVVLAPMIMAPVDQVLRAARARGGGQRQARVGAVRGLRDLRELAATFDQMADQLGREDQLRRNLLSYIAHDLRTPISVLQASTEAMLDGVTEITPTSVESLHDESVMLGQMVDDLRLLAAAEVAALQLKLSRCDLAVLAAQAADSLKIIFDAAQVRLTRQLNTVQVRCDQARIREVILNLLTNAAKFTPAGGQVTIETRRSGDRAVIRVSDTGIGIPPEDLPHLTKQFYRGRGVAQISGSGLGLAIVDELVRAHRGTIDIASQPSRGTQVTIKIPSEVQATGWRASAPAEG
jgi:signal transduction histidine kinase